MTPKMGQNGPPKIVAVGPKSSLDTSPPGPCKPLKKKVNFEKHKITNSGGGGVGGGGGRGRRGGWGSGEGAKLSRGGWFWRGRPKWAKFGSKKGSFLGPFWAENCSGRPVGRFWLVKRGPFWPDWSAGAALGSFWGGPGSSAVTMFNFNVN